MTYDFHPGARRDLRGAADRYRAENAALPRRFLAAVDEAIQRILDSPSSMSIYDDEIRYCPVKGFPYVILFRNVESIIQILAAKHTSRDEAFWINRIDEP